MAINASPLCFGYHYHVVDKPTNWALVRENIKSQRERILANALKWAAKESHDTYPEHTHNRKGWGGLCTCGCDGTEA